MSPRLIAEHPSTTAPGFEVELLARLMDPSSHLAVSLPLQNRPWTLLGESALRRAGESLGLTLVVAPHAASFADATSVLDELSQQHGLNWINLGADLSPPASFKARERIAGGLVHLALIDWQTLAAGHPHPALLTTEINHLALWQAHQLPLAALSAWWAHATKAQTCRVSSWMPNLPLSKFTQQSTLIVETLQLPQAGWSVLPPAFERAEVTVIRKVTERLKCNKLLHLMKREAGPRQPAQIIVVPQTAAVAPMAHWLSDRLRRPISALSPDRAFRQQVSLLNQLRYSGGQIMVLPESMVDTVTVAADRPIRWIVWQPLSSLDVLTSIAFTASGGGHVPTECLVFHTRDDILTRRERLQRRHQQQPGSAADALTELSRWHRWILSNNCRRTSLMKLYAKPSHPTLPVWLPCWDEHPPLPCGDCDRCHAPNKSLISRLQPWFNRLIY